MPELDKQMNDLNTMSTSLHENIVESQDKLGESWNLINNYDLSEFQIFEKTNASDI